jgi:hypothetical protein
MRKIILSLILGMGISSTAMAYDLSCDGTLEGYFCINGSPHEVDLKCQTPWAGGVDVGGNSVHLSGNNDGDEALECDEDATIGSFKTEMKCVANYNKGPKIEVEVKPTLDEDAADVCTPV